MAIIKCKMCGGDMEIAADKTFGTCEYCGSTMTLPKVDDKQRAAAFNRSNHFRRVGEFDKALAVYERIMVENDGDAVAHWCCALCRFGIEYVEDPPPIASVRTMDTNRHCCKLIDLPLHCDILSDKMTLNTN